MSEATEIVSALGGGAVIIAGLAKGGAYVVGFYKERLAKKDQRLDAEHAAKQTAAAAQRASDADATQRLVDTLQAELERANRRSEIDAAAKTEIARAMAEVGRGMADLARVATEHQTSDRESHQRILDAVGLVRSDLDGMQRAFDIFVARFDASSARAPTGENVAAKSPGNT